MENNGLTPDEELELLELEEEEDREKDEEEREELERLKLEEEELSLAEKRLDIEWAKRQARNNIGFEEFGGFLAPESEEEANEYAKTYEKQGKAATAYFRTESPLTNWIYAGARKAKYWIEGIFEKEDNEPFDLETKMEEDLIPESERDLYEGVSNLREYNYIKEGIDREHEDESLLSEDDGIFSMVPGMLEFAMFPGAGKIAGKVGASIKVGKGATLTDGINKIL